MRVIHIYLGTFLIAFSTLALEVSLVRLLSVITWYHLAFFAIATALLGMTAGATTVYLRPSWFTEEKLNDNVAKACFGYTLVVPVTLVVLSIIPLGPHRSVMAIFPLIIGTAAASLPFYFSGIAISAVLTKHRLPIGKLYASDMIGASLGSLFVLKGLELLDAPSLILLCGSGGILAAISFRWRGSSSKAVIFGGMLFSGLVLLAFANASTSYGIRPLVVKGQIERVGRFYLEEWNSFSRVVVYKQETGSPQYWGASPVAPDDEVVQHAMNIDGDAATTLGRFSSFDDIDHLRYDVTNLAYHLRPKGGAFIIGVGGGRDIQSAILFGHERVVGVDVNPIFINLLEGEFREFAGISDRPGVTLIADEARSHLSRTKEQYSLIQMSLIDTLAATGAGAFSLSENALYTTEAWKIFFNRLSDDGIFTVSRWYGPDLLGETGRIMSLAVATLIQSGVTDPSRHIAMGTSGRLATLLVSRQPFSDRDIAKLHEVTSELQYDLVIVPDVAPNNEILRGMVSVSSMDELKSLIENEPLNYEPPTDENPYFFNMLRLTHLGAYLDALRAAEGGVNRGNLLATITLLALILSLLFIALVTIVVPLILRTRSEILRRGSASIIWPGALYFSLIGAGFMFVEIALIQRLSVFLSNPVFALGILLFTIIASTGIGSFLSEHLPLTRSPWIFVYPITMALAIIGMRFALPVILSNMITSPINEKVIVSILVISPLGVLMGFFFPTGMRLVRSANAPETPWYWALNGIFSVLCSALAVFISIYLSISTNFHIAAVCYALLLISIVSIYSKSKARVPAMLRVNAG